MTEYRRLKITEKTIIENATIGHPGDRGDVIEIVGDAASGTVIRDCTVYGGIRIYGQAKNGNETTTSHLENHSRIVQDAAPKDVRLEDLRIHANQRIPVYFGPGAMYCQLDRSVLTGRSVSSVVYLDAESRYINVVHNDIDVRGPREVISIDGSSHACIAWNTIKQADRGGVYVYRNSGEAGRARHQWAMRNEITMNSFHYTGKFGFPRWPRPTIWLGYNDLYRVLFHSWRDRHIAYGSGKSNYHTADFNLVCRNKYIGRPRWCRKVKDCGRENEIEWQ